MPTKTQKADSKSLLRSLPQATVAEVFGVAPVWLRDNAHLVPRNDDGTYDAGEVAKALRTDFQPAELPDATLERVLLLIDLIYVSDAVEVSMPGVIGVLESIDQDHGAAGMAAFGYLLLDSYRDFKKRYVGPSELRPTPEAIRSEYTAKAESEIAELPRWGAWRELRAVSRCSECGRRRRGGKWVEGPTPADHEEHSTICPECLDR